MGEVFNRLEGVFKNKNTALTFQGYTSYKNPNKLYIFQSVQINSKCSGKRSFLNCSHINSQQKDFFVMVLNYIRVSNW